MIDRQQLKDLFVAMSDRTGRDIDPVTFKIYCDFFDEEEFLTATIIDGMTHLVRTWEKNWWPSADIIASTSRRIAIEKYRPVGKSLLVEQTTAAVERDAEERQRRIALANEWAAANEEQARAIRRQLTKEYRGRVATAGRLSGFYRIARDEAILTALVNAARGVALPDETIDPGVAAKVAV